MADFLQVDYFAGIADVVIKDLQRRLLRGNENDVTIIKATYTAQIMKDYAESFSLDADEVAGLVVNVENGTAEAADGRKYSGRPSLGAFIEYVWKGRKI